MKSKVLALAALPLLPGISAIAQTPTPTPAPTTVAAGILHPTDGSARVNGVRILTQPDGSVWFLEATSDSIVKLKDGVMRRWPIRQSTTASPLGANPVDFQIDGDVVWFIESGESLIPPLTCAYAKLDTSTNTLTEWVVPGTIPAAFYRAPDGTIWLPQTAAAMQNVNLETGQVINYRSTKTYAYADMVVGPDGAFWMADFGDNRIVRWVPGAATETSWTFYPLANGRLNPAQIRFDDQGFLWIAQFSASRMDRFDPATGELRSYNGIANPNHFDFFQERLYVTSAVTRSTVSVFDPQLATATQIQTLTPETLDVRSTVNPKTAYKRCTPPTLNPCESSITPTDFVSAPAVISADQFTVTSPGVSYPGILTTAFPSTYTHTYGVTVAGGAVWVGIDGQLAELNLQSIGGPTDQSVPVATSLPGPANSRVRIDLTLSNSGAASFSGDALYLFSPGSFAPRKTLELAPGETLFLEDAFGNVASTQTNGPVRLRTTSGDAAALVASARSVRVLPDGSTFGYAYPAAAAGGSLGSGSTTTLFTGASSSEISILGLTTLDAASVTLTLFAPDGTTRGTRDVTLVKNTLMEFNPAASAFGVAAEPGDVVRVEVKSGTLRPYMNVYDTGTSDVAPSLPVAATAAAVVPNVASLPVSDSQSLVSDLFLANPDSELSADVTLSYYPLGVEGPPQVASLTLAPLASQAIANVLSTLLGVTSGQGAMVVTSSVPVASAIRAATHMSAGDYGTFAGAIDQAAGVAGGNSASFIGAPQTSTRSTNLLLYNLGSAGAVTVTGFKPDGTEAGHTTVSLGDHGAGRLDAVFAAFGITNQPAGKIRLDVPAGMNVFAWTAEIDGITGDIDIALPH